MYRDERNRRIALPRRITELAKRATEYFAPSGCGMLFNLVQGRREPREEGGGIRDGSHFHRLVSRLHPSSLVGRLSIRHAFKTFRVMSYEIIPQLSILFDVFKSAVVKEDCF